MKGPRGRGHAEIAVCAAPLDEARDEGPDRRRVRAKTPDPEASAQAQHAALFSSMSAADADSEEHEHSTERLGNPFSSATQAQHRVAGGSTHGSGYLIRRLMRKACSHAGRLDTDPPVSAGDMYLYPGDAPWKQQTTLTHVSPAAPAPDAGRPAGPLSPSADIEGRNPIDGTSSASDDR